MAKISPLLKDIDAAQAARFPAITVLPKTAAPYTTVTNRAEVTDFAADGLPKFGIERVMFFGIEEVQGETGPDGQRVWRPLNDLHNQVRFVGSWKTQNNEYGVYTDSSVSADYFEITFCGTGLNSVSIVNSAKTFYVAVDGGSESPIAVTGIDLLGSRKYGMNTVASLVSGLTAGLHTVKIRGTGLTIQGFEAVNTGLAVLLPPASSYIGGRRLYSAEASSMSYNSDFESGTLGTRGGHVLIYQKADGTIAKAVTPTDSAAVYLSSADHTNEEIIRTYNFREFGAGRSDDWSYNNAAATRAFTLDDGTTSLASDSAFAGVVNGVDAFAPNSTNFFVLTFVGTGLDVQLAAQATTGAMSAYTYSVDGATPAAITFSQTTTALTTYRIVSGLPYGTHTVKFAVTAVNTTRLYWSNFIVYGPKKPSLPSGAVALADYFLMADFAANLTYGSNHRPSTGVLRKLLTREAVFTGTWAVSSNDANFASGFNIRSNTNGSTFELTFFGTGLNLRMHFPNATFAYQFFVDGAAPGPGSSFTYQGSGMLYDGSTGSMSGTVSGAAGYGGALFQVTGLTLGVHKVKVLYTGGTDYLYADSCDIITPVHAPKLNSPGDIQNTLPVGSCAIRDLRKFSETTVKELPNWAQAVGISVSPSTTASAAVPCPDMSVTIKTSGNPVEISYAVSLYASLASSHVNTIIYIDGVPCGVLKNTAQAVAGYQWVGCDSVIVPLAAGVHKIDVYWYTNGTATAHVTYRNLKAREL